MRSAVRWIVRVAMMVAVYLWVVGMAVRCASAPKIPEVPTPQNPEIACLADFPLGAINPQTGGKRMPDLFRLIGETSMTDGYRGKAVFGYFNQQACIDDIDGDACGWVPIEASRIKRGAICGPESQALRELQAASR